jgi:hypothetical protein
MEPVITVALVDDYDVVLLGLARTLEGYRDRVSVVEIDANEAVDDVVDIVLYDSFAQPESDQDEIAVLVGTRAPTAWWSTPGTSTPSSSTTRYAKEPTPTCPRH